MVTRNRWISPQRKLVAQWVMFRAEKGWSQRQAAMDLEINQSTLSRIESLQEKPSRKVLGQMAYLIITRSNKTQAF